VSPAGRPTRLARAARLAAVALLAGAPLAAPARASESPRILYMLNCQGCHLPDGSGSPGSVPSLRGSVARFLTVPGGRAFLVRVPGAADAPLSDTDLAAVLNWMVRRFGPAPDAAAAPPYTAEEVGALRARPLVDDVESVRRELVGRLGAP
jgi:mono/diheme cytochrome c family protein